MHIKAFSGSLAKMLSRRAKYAALRCYLYFINRLLLSDTVCSLLSISTRGWAYTSFLIALVFFTFVFPARASNTPCPGRVDLEIAHGPVQSGRAVFYLTYTPTTSGHAGPVLIHFGPNNSFDIKDDNDKVVSDWTLAPNFRTRFNLVVKQNNPGLLELVATTNWDPSCRHPDYAVDTGFRDIVVLESKTKGFAVESDSFIEPDPIQRGQQAIWIDFLDRNSHRPLTLGAPVTLEIIADGSGSLLQKDGSWKNSLLLTTDGSRMSAVQIKNDDWGSSATIVFNVLTNPDPSSPAIANFRIKYRTDYPSYVLFLMTLLGALLYVAIESIPALNRPADGSPAPPYWRILLKDDGSKLFVALIVAVVAFLMRDTSILGTIKFDPTTLKGYAILGLFTNVIGLEAIFKKVKQLID
jgi:hypothetical protein